jgi:putative hydroxymethylpyrimidine transport system substrate-binding protein
MRPIWWGLTLVLVSFTAAVAGCGGASEADAPRVKLQNTRDIDITLDGYPSPENVGILMADRRGYFEDAGLEIWVRTPQSRLRPLPYVAEGEVDLAISHGPQVALAEKKDAQVAAFASLISQPTAAVIWLERSGIGGIADLKGKTIGITGLPFERDLLDTLLGRAGLTLDDVKVRRFDYDLLPALVKGRADAILGSWSVEGSELEARGLHPVVTRVQDLGIPPYDELVLIGRPAFLAKNPKSIRDFLAAVAKGTEGALEDPEAAARLVALSNGDPLSKATEAATQATLPLLSADQLEPSP